MVLGDKNVLKQRVVKPVMVIVGNKSDLRADQRQVPTEDGRKLAEQFNCSFTEARASVATSNNSKISTPTAGALITGWDFVTEILCRAAIVLCPMFYLGRPRHSVPLPDRTPGVSVFSEKELHSMLEDFCGSICERTQ